MYRLASYLLLPLMWVNLTTGENRWEIFGLGIGQLVYWIIIVLGWYVSWHTPYRLFATGMLMFAMAMRVFEALGGGDMVTALRIAALAVVFVVAGAKIYGRDPDFLHRQLVVFLGLCVAVMVLQVLGVSQLVMAWSTGYAHDPSLMLEEEIGTMREVPLYPTLFVAYEDLQYGIGQGRPVGLMHSSNVLSIFVAVAVAINLCIERSSRLRVSDLVVTAAVVLTMSKLVFAVTAFLYLFSIAFGFPARRRLGLQLTFVLALGIGVYYLLFPGLLMANFSEDMLRTSIILRLMGLVTAIGFDNVAMVLYDQQLLLGSQFQEDHDYSSVAMLLRSQIVLPALFMMGVGFLFYLRRVRKMKGLPVNLYMTVTFVCALTQFAVPFAAAASFQLMMGLGLFPLVRKLWPALPSASGEMRGATHQETERQVDSALTPTVVRGS